MRTDVLLQLTTRTTDSRFRIAATQATLFFVICEIRNETNKLIKTKPHGFCGGGAAGWNNLVEPENRVKDSHHVTISMS
ncbi:hypothetical protein L596_014252 [Steinernema carpocapsae]|uniref:Uncharacterized protein n=1 Tax=Steinernema carpocapsae TaxID=34508 RepID=A0A4U5NBA5_STECR|nr:hypothetical protein L596_014252 [Steinernema carpocapsae]